MSAVDTSFDERVQDFIEDHEGMSFIAKQARTLYEEKDFERLKRFMSDIEGAESAQHFHDNEILGDRDDFRVIDTVLPPPKDYAEFMERGWMAIQAQLHGLSVRRKKIIIQ